MFLTAKLNLLSGMAIGAGAVLLMKQCCKQKKQHKKTTKHHSSDSKPKGRRNVGLGTVTNKQQQGAVIRISSEAALFTTDKFLLSSVTPWSLLTHDFE